MSSKNNRIEALLQKLQGRSVNAHYLGFVQCFNQQLFFEAHEVLEQIWLPQRTGPDGGFFKGLIQFAGAFVHIQKSRVGPALSLLRLAQENLGRYPAVHHCFEVATILEMIQEWRQELESRQADSLNFSSKPFPKLVLIDS